MSKLKIISERNPQSQKNLLLTVDEIIHDEIITFSTMIKILDKGPCQFNIHSNGVQIPTNKHLLIKNIMIQILRNSIDHGIEKPEERKKAGKNPQGTISISTEKAENYIRIMVQDDGYGLNLDLLFQKGLQINKLASNADDDTIANLIFQQGVSTAEKISYLSGRGIGMDAVKSFLNELGGEIKIVFTNKKKSSGHRNFYFDIKIPA